MKKIKVELDADLAAQIAAALYAVSVEFNSHTYEALYTMYNEAFMKAALRDLTSEEVRKIYKST